MVHDTSKNFFLNICTYYSILNTHVTRIEILYDPNRLNDDFWKKTFFKIILMIARLVFGLETLSIGLKHGSWIPILNNELKLKAYSIGTLNFFFLTYFYWVKFDLPIMLMFAARIRLRGKMRIRTLKGTVALFKPGGTETP